MNLGYYVINVETVKGLAYSDHAYEAAKARLNESMVETCDRFKPISMSYVS